MRQTSISCYNTIKSNGLLSKRRFQAYEFLCNHAPCTASELQAKMVYKDGGRDVQKRLSELRKSGVISEKRVRECRITGQKVIEWELTNKLPKKIRPITTTKSHRIKKAILALAVLRTKSPNITDEDWLSVAGLIDKI